MSVSVRDLIKQIQMEVRDTSLQPERAAVLVNKLSALIGNINDEIRVADLEYSNVLLELMKEEKVRNRAEVRAETTPAYLRKREARDYKELATELIASLKYQVRLATEEMRLTK